MKIRITVLFPLFAAVLMTAPGCGGDEAEDTNAGKTSNPTDRDAGRPETTDPAPEPDAPALVRDWDDPLAPESADVIAVTKSSGAVPLDPMSEAWKSAPYYAVSMKPQQEQSPSLHDSSVDTLRVQGLSDGTDFAFRLSWCDSTQDANVDVSRFTDAVSLAFPLHEDSSPQMGSEGAPIQVVVWKALWQKDIDEHFQDVQDLHPNYWSDLYWFAEGEFPYPVPESFRNPAAAQYFVARQAGNSVASWDRERPIQEGTAEGPGTFSQQSDEAFDARGHWQEGRWAVVFRRSLSTEDAEDYQLSLGKSGKVAFALWDGSAGCVGARKHWSTNWFTLEVQP